MKLSIPQWSVLDLVASFGAHGATLGQIMQTGNNSMTVERLRRKGLLSDYRTASGIVWHVTDEGRRIPKYVVRTLAYYHL